MQLDIDLLWAIPPVIEKLTKAGGIVVLSDEKGMEDDPRSDFQRLVRALPETHKNVPPPYLIYCVRQLIKFGILYRDPSFENQLGGIVITGLDIGWRQHLGELFPKKEGESVGTVSQPQQQQRDIWGQVWSVTFKIGAVASIIGLPLSIIGTWISPEDICSFIHGLLKWISTIA